MTTNEERQPIEEEPTDLGDGELEPRLVPRIYVASLSDYNSGYLHGSWLDAAQTVDGIESGIAAMLAGSPTPGAEEWAIHDYEGFGGIAVHGYEDLTLLTQLAEGLTRHGPAFASWVQVVGRDPEELQRFEEAYLGNHPSLAAYAEELLDSLGVIAEFDRWANDHLGEHLAPYVQWDFEGLGRDLDYGGDIRAHERDDGSLDVFEGGSA
jgi:antirestriction protein